MAYVADLHIHSRFAYATSKELNIPTLTKWARRKGIDLLGTGDCLHPTWRKEFKLELQDLGNGLFLANGVKFVLQTEVSCIYSQGGKLRRIHFIILFPSLQTVEKVAAELEKRGAKLTEDGRPTLGMSAIDLCDLLFTINPKIIVIPAHAWTPWFGMYGSNSGFDFFAECFGKFSNQIYAIETGLSSEPLMNWRISELDTKSIVSFSDAHSAPNLGRELTIFKGNMSYDELRDDLINQNIAGTIEFFPEEGKYHYSGHRDCGIVYSPEDVRAKGEICPVCHKRLTIGVMQRVEELATRSVTDLQIENKDGLLSSQKFPNRPPFQMLVELDKIIADAYGMGRKSKKVIHEYEKLTSELGNELFVLTKASYERIKSFSGSKIAEGVMRVREGKLKIEPGFDSTYGKINIFFDEDEEIKQVSLF